MGKAIIGAEISSIVNDLQPVGINNIVYEAITNSLQANAKKINIRFIQNSLDIPETKRYIDEVIIEDNGEGFTQENTDSFKTYRSTLKRHLGAKGIGRFLFLKLFDRVTVNSLDKVINFSTDKDIVIKYKQENTLDLTKIVLENPNKKLIFDFKSFEQKLKDHFLPYFKLLDEKVIINIYKNDDKLYSVDSKDIPSFKTDTFKVGKHSFNIDYVIDDEKIKDYDGYYCAGDRVVLKNSEMDSKVKLKAFKDVNIFYLISSEYFNHTVTNERDEFKIKPVQKNQDLFGNLSWKDIITSLTDKIKSICNDNNIDIDKIAKKQLLTSINKMPFLGHYLRKNKNEDALPSDTLIANAKKALEDDKKFLRENKKKDDEEYKFKLSIVTQAELAEYIYERQKTIETLQKLTDDEAYEKEIHSLCMEMKTTDENKDYRSNNLWLFDDRFMTYDKVFSDQEIEKIFPELSKNLERPDLLSIVSNTVEEDKITDIVVIELKKPDKKITPAGAEEQLLRYARYINESRQENKIRIWTYAFLTFNDEVVAALKDKAYNRIFTQSKYPIYYGSPGNNNIIINFMDYEALVHDADLRNQTFMKILKGDSFKKEK